MDESIPDINNYISRLSVPAEQFDALTYCASTPEALKEYLDRLPHSNAAELCNRLYKLLPQLAGLRASPGRKINLLDLVKPEAMDCVERLTKNLAITPANAKLLSLAIAMLKYLAEGYKSIIVSVLQSAAAPPELLIGACYSTLTVLRKVLMDCWECYVPPPPRIWFEMHAVYQIARMRGIEKAAVHKRALGQPRDNTIRSSYVIPLMTFCADPGRYTPQDLRQIEYFLQTSAHLVDFDSGQSDGIFIIDPLADEGPQYSFKVEMLHNRQFRLRTYRLVRHIEEELAMGSLVGLNERLARDLCKYWSMEIQRREDPESDDTELTIVIGLSHIHRYLTNTRNLTDYLSRIRGTGHGKGSLLEIVSDDHHGPRDTFLEKKQPVNMLGTRHARPEHTNDQAPAPALRRYPATRTNVSSRGARIEFDAPMETLTAGEVILLQPAGNNHWQVGMVRWTQVTRSLTRLLGLEVLADVVKPCAVAQSTGVQGEDQFFSGLVFQAGNKKRVILPALPFKPYSSVKLLTAEARLNTKLEECEDATFHISIFNLESGSQG